MKVSKAIDIKSSYSFEAPIINTGNHGGKEFESLDLNELIAPVADNYYVVRVKGDSMIDEQIFEGDLLIVARNEQPRSGKIVIAALNGEMAVKKLLEQDGQVFLVSANKRFLPIEIKGFMHFEIQGVVKFVIHKPDKLK
jgi:DNA polymerase V